jgi:very-short-patch-repair endonuclease
MLMPDRKEIRDRARAMRKAPTPAEKALWQMLRGGRLDGLKFRRQVPIGPYIADFACNSPKVIIECDGGQHALSDYDARRDAWFQADGYRVLRFWNGEINDHPESVRLGILSALGKG